MSDTTIKKVDSTHSPHGAEGQTYLASGKRVSMRLWEETPSEKRGEHAHAHDYEVVGYVIEGKAELHLEDQRVMLEAGDSWVVPAGARHRYNVLEPLKAVEATTPPARVHGRDERGG